VNGMRLTILEDGQAQLNGIDWVTAACLLEVPALLPQAKDGPARGRLFPNPSTDAKVNDDWQHYVTPELETLFAAAGDILAKDIQLLAESKEALKGQSVTFPLRHCDAWISAINQARLILGAQHNVTDADMDDHEFSDPNDPKQQAVLRIHVLGYLLQVLVEFMSGN